MRREPCDSTEPALRPVGSDVHRSPQHGPVRPPSGCRFRTRCPECASQLTDSERAARVEQVPDLLDRGGGNPVACHYAENVQLL
ncbi:hypothetical protein ACWDGI_29530 [Streptomyces sp. NPDC001220]